MSAAADARLDRPAAIAIARAFVDLIDECCETLTVAGSLRRRLARIGDIEVVAVPRVETYPDGLLGDQVATVDRLADRMDVLLANGTVTKRLDARGSPRWGPTVKYLTYHGARVDLFCPSAERLGWILLLRTGPAAFSRQLVVERGRKTKDGRPGLLPPTIVPRDGWLTRRVSAERIETPDERSVFDLFGLDWISPWERS